MKNPDNTQNAPKSETKAQSCGIALFSELTVERIMEIVR
jgi:hypothetical protein